MGFLRTMALRILGFEPKKIRVERDGDRIITCYRPYPAADRVLVVVDEDGAPIRPEEIRTIKYIKKGKQRLP